MTQLQGRHNVPLVQGIFITFEGTEGAGKSTVMRLLGDRLTALGVGVTVTREPGGSPVAERIRSVLLAEAMDPWAELFLYEAARAEHLARTIRPALASGHIVLCDRYADSSLAYQGFARGLPWKQVKSLNRIATQGLIPALTVLLDVDPAVGLARASDKNRFEAEGIEFQRKVRRGFLKSRSENPGRWLVIKPGSKTPEQLADRILKEFDRRFRLSRRAAGGRNG